jgi:5-methylcytosine-specific restriction endonuclease McrA
MSRFKGEYVKDRKALHNAVRADAGNRCIRCGHPQGDRQVITDDRLRVAKLKADYPNAVVHSHTWDATDEDGWRVVLQVACDDACTHVRDGKLRILTVHHLDGHKANNAWWNLLALCQACHLTIQGKVIPERPYLWPHTKWFKPYVCGFYAHYYGKQAITRAEADATPERWLAMGQPWLYAQDEATA